MSAKTLLSPRGFSVYWRATLLTAFALGTTPTFAAEAPDVGLTEPSAQSDDAGASPQTAKTERDGFAVDAMATTLVPVSVGPELGAELPGRILARVHLGWMPELYSNGLTDTLEDAGVYDAAVGALIDGAFQGATTWRLAAGWRPFPEAGLELTVGYVHVALDGSTTTGEVMQLVPPELAEELETNVGDVALNLDSSIQHLSVHVGWRWIVAERLLLAANIGYMQAVDSRSQLQIESYPRLSRLTSSVVDNVLHDHYMRYVKLPVVGLSVGYRFF